MWPLASFRCHFRFFNNIVAYQSISPIAWMRLLTFSLPSRVLCLFCIVHSPSLIFLCTFSLPMKCSHNYMWCQQKLIRSEYLFLLDLKKSGIIMNFSFEFQIRTQYFLHFYYPNSIFDPNLILSKFWHYPICLIRIRREFEFC